MKRILFVFIMGFCALWTHPLWGYAGERYVTVADDSLYREGTLRTILQSSCEEEGDDTILFERTRLAEIRIILNEPLVIPPGCRGRVIIKGSEMVETIIDGSHLTGGGTVEGDSCLLHIYSNRHTIENLIFTGNSNGAGLCVFGRENRIVRNRFRGETGIAPNLYGIVLSNHFGADHAGMDGGNNQVINNEISSGSLHGIFSRADNNILETNRVDSPREMGIVQLGNGAIIRSDNRISNPGRIGIFLKGNNSFLARNRIENSQEDGIKLLGDHDRISGNLISNSGWSGIALDGNDLTVDEENEITGSHENGISGRGTDIVVDHNRVSGSHKNGLSLEGERLLISGNEIFTNGWSGLRLQATNSQVLRNQIIANGGCPEDQRLASQSVECFVPTQGEETGGPGVLVEAGSHDIVIGSESFERDRNIIQYNRDGGVLILGDGASEHHHVTHNTISRNYGPEPDLDLLGDGITWNDLDDSDEGPNHLLNTIDYLQIFPLVNSPTGEARYWSWGVARYGNAVELYGVPEDDRGRGRTHGGGETFYGESPVVGRTLRISPHASFNSFENQLVTVLSFTDPGDTSEYAANVMAGRDQDLDGIVDSLETGDGTPASRSSSPAMTDSDGDGLPDSVEDANRNGRLDSDLGETSAYNPDTDGDGLSDWAETHGEGHYDPETDTDPLNPDTDGDGLRDGEEDSNGNGIWENYSGESSPLLIDSDNDGIVDGLDNCRNIYNPGQEPWMCGRS